jgi:hypothetical protein
MSKFQPNRAGLPTPQIQDAVHHVHDRTAEHAQSVAAGKARSHRGGIDPRVGGKPKQGMVQVHGAMTAEQIKGAGIGGMGHATNVVDGGMNIATSAAAVPPVPLHRRAFNPVAPKASPITHAYGENPSTKAGKPVPAVPGQRSRTTDTLGASRPGENHANRKPHDPALGEAILRAAFDASGPDDRAAHGRNKP